ncbi:MAG: heat-inducible transcription repressor HrcA [Woeseiaceae bacterium]|nr:heat-inducible transcription repressor HrcA [Woeseiaceae bacterium]
MRVAPTERAQYLLKILIQKYINEGNPIGSRNLLEDSGLNLSPATVRHVMSDLEELGLIKAPHTSSGRIPTARGYRMFVDTLVRYQSPESSQVDTIQSQIERDNYNTGKLIKKVSSTLSKITSLAGVVTVPKVKNTTLRQIEFLPLSNQRILVILVLNNREVQNRILHTKVKHSASELQRAANFINKNYANQSLDMIRDNLLHAMEETRESMNQAMQDIITTAQVAIDGADNLSEEFILAGERNLMDFAELSNVNTLKQLFDAFAKKRMMIDLLDRSISASGVQIFIGSESGYSLLDDCSIVTAPYQLNDNQIGVLGVIGPKRMAYDRVVPIVDLTAKMLGAAIENK